MYATLYEVCQKMVKRSSRIQDHSGPCTHAKNVYALSFRWLTFVRQLSVTDTTPVFCRVSTLEDKNQLDSHLCWCAHVPNVF